MKHHLITSVLALLAATPMTRGAEVLSLPMDISGGRLNGKNVSLSIEGRFAPMQIAGKEGNAWRTDGNSSRATGQIPLIVDGDRMTATIRFAVDTYAIIEHETGTSRFVEIMSCLDEGARTGFGFFMNRTGKYMVRVYVGGEAIEIAPDEAVPLWEWTDLSVTVDGNNVRLYRNGHLKGERQSSSRGVKAGNCTLYLGRANAHGELGGTEICAFNGAFDSLTVHNDIVVDGYSASYADLNLPSDRYDSDMMRARYHGQPGMNWTNETHGLFHNSAGDGKWHAFFQRTGSTPMMSHQHWGHIVSYDLITWRDEKPALAPSEFYDIKGCWSGCVFSDPAFNNGNPTIIYTGVDFARPYAATAYCDDKNNLRRWHKDPANPIYVTENCGDARDTYFYRTDADNAYFLIGARDAVHYYRWDNGHWAYKGEFYHTQQGVDNGHNTEMPNVTRIGDKWVMTTSPLAGMYGTACLYRTGDLSDGRFVNYSEAERVDFFGRDGYGLLSPSPGTTPDGRTVAIGIVPDKLPGDLNIRHGYAHLYSLPREWSLDPQGKLLQKPYDAIYEYRNDNISIIKSEFTVEGNFNLNPVAGREAEVNVTFGAIPGRVGINFFKDASGNAACLSYNPENREIKIDYSRIRHYDNGRHEFTSVLPLGPGKGEDLKLQLFIDHSIIDIFVNDRYASSVRIFAEDNNAERIELFADSPTFVKHLEAYVLGNGDLSEEPETPPTSETLESTGKVALLIAYQNLAELSENRQEKATYDYFIEAFPTGTVLYAGEYERINASDFDCVWVNCDRKGIEEGWENLPYPLSDTNFVSTLRQYSAEGGNLYLSKMASQLSFAIGRAGECPIVWGSGEGDMKNDEWLVNVNHHGNDYSYDILFTGIEIRDAGYGQVFTLMSGEHIREDHNCMWDLGRYQGGHDAYCAQNNARVLGTWGHDGGQDCGGLIEFYPAAASHDKPSRATAQSVIDARKGTVIVNGLAAYEWAPANGVNLSHANIERLTTNILYYLSPKNDLPTGIDPPTSEALESTGKVALFIAYQNVEELSENRQEKATYDYFIEAFPTGTVLYAGEYDRINASDFDCVWVNCDRKGIDAGWENLPYPLSDTNFVNTLRQYSAGGGNLYLSKMASQLSFATGRAGECPIEWSNGDGGLKNDEWLVNVSHHGNDWSENILFTGIEIRDAGYGRVFTLMSGEHIREDHNCMWKLGDYPGGHDAYCAQNNARVLGTWGHDGGQEWGGLIEFYPAAASHDKPSRATAQSVVDARKGTMIVNGLAAYEWAPANGVNLSHANIERLTTNILSYLSPKSDLPTEIEDIYTESGDAEEPAAYYNLQGIRIDNPTQGIYIEVRGKKTRKIVL